MLLVSKMEIGGNLAFFRDNEASFEKKNPPYIALYFTTFLNYCCFKLHGYTPNFLFGFQWPLLRSAFPEYIIIINHTTILLYE